MIGAIVWLSVAASPAHVQQCSTQDPTAATHQTISCTLPRPTTRGNLLVASCAWGSQDFTVSVLADNSIAFTQAIRQFEGNYAQGLAIFYLPNAPEGLTSISCVYESPADHAGVLAHEYSGVATENPLSGTATLIGAGASGRTNPLLTPDAGHLLYGVLEDVRGTTATITAGAGFTLRAGRAGDQTADEDQVQAAGGPAMASFNVFPTTDDWICQLATFSPASGGTDPADRFGVACGCSSGGALGLALLWLTAARFLARRKTQT